jgi:TatD DNase family protein
MLLTQRQCIILLFLTSLVAQHNITFVSSLAIKVMSEVAVVDIGVNLTHRAFRKHWRNVVQRAIDTGVTKLILTGTSISGSKECLELCQTWLDETGTKNLYTTVGVHPHDAKTWNNEHSYNEMKEMLTNPLAVAVGECGLDFNRNFSTPNDQIHAFREQVKLAVELNMPLFLHEREAHTDLVKVLDEIKEEMGSLPPIVVHCFTGMEQEAMEYIAREYYIGFTGTICKKERGAPLRDMLPSIPLEKIMVETDAPFMGFQRGRKSSEPADCIEVARKLAETVDIEFSTVCETTTASALDFFRIKE